jgi:hypothetical protein
LQTRVARTREIISQNDYRERHILIRHGLHPESLNLCTA